MQSPNSLSNKAEGPFWKKGSKHLPGSIKAVYGAQHPPLNQNQALPGFEKYTTAVPKANQSSGDSISRVAPASHVTNMSTRSSRGRGAAKNVPSSSSFQEFQQDTDDAWEIDPADDDLLASQEGVSVSNAADSCGDTAAVHISAEDARSAALAVIQQHRRVSNKLSTNNTTSSNPRAPAGKAVRRTAGNYPISKESAYKQLNELPDRETSKLDKFRTLIQSPSTDLDELRKLSWSGIPKEVRSDTWKLLSGYLPPNVERRKPTLKLKRSQYFTFIEQYYHTRHEEQHVEMYRQIHIDIPRMNPLISLFQQEVVQEIFERILYIWAMRHPASGYVQGINDLVTPFFVVFLSNIIDSEVNVENFDVSELDEQDLGDIEADSFWCTSKLLDGIQDNYTFAQPGIQIKVNQMKDLVKRIDDPLHQHLCEHHVEYLQFAFRWMNNLLMREIPLRCTIRLWDTYLSEPEGFATFHLYVCVAFLTHWSRDLNRERDFQGIMLLLQSLPTAHWGNEEIAQLLAEAYKLKYMFADAPNHLSTRLR